MSDLSDQYEMRLIELGNVKEREKEQQRQELTQIINELKSLLEQEKQKMGEAGKLRERQLLGEIDQLKKQLDDKDAYIATLAKTIANLEKDVKQRDGTIAEHLEKIASLESKIRTLEEKLSLAMESGDQAMNNLRAQLTRLQEEFEAFKVKAKRDLDSMQDELRSKHEHEMDALRQKYEQMIREMQMNASNDKEFVQNELRKKILALEKQIEDLRRENGDEKSRLLKQIQDTIRQFEDQILALKNDHRQQTADMQSSHSKEINKLQKDHEDAINALRKNLSSDQQAALDLLRK